jgi:hypothetical protein
VSQNQLIRRLKREATRNPKKCGALGLLLAVALWFWAPLVRGWFTKDGPAPAPQGSPTAVASTPAWTPGLTERHSLTPATKPAGATYSWDQVAEWMEKDPLTKAAATLPARRDPFRASPDIVAVEAARERQRKKPQHEAPAVTAVELGLKLTGTIVGPKQSVALINGRTYRQGTQIACEKGGSRYSLRLVEVRRKDVVLECRGTRLQLAISE